MRGLLGRRFISPVFRYFSTETQLPQSAQVPPPRILFFGTDSFSRASLQKLCEAKQGNPELYTSLDVATRDYKAPRTRRDETVSIRTTGGHLSLLLSKSGLTKFSENTGNGKTI